ncbi:2-(5''-triphosphoribosyl)-3'-dephosphocoenzyme-A synthase [Mesoplasma sp. JKS002658]|uniref:triphosphoribosyl-dephospho-CoA synthase n=1 Tax=Mesoplasma whartonense TaxID=2878854 RepID=UPI002022A366|nr:MULTISPECIES: triphosphoribosyl-dephospho-CoA synthase [unclassified Mesoplasma]MCL8211454.1 2-(5''-triphosphoribosyl)-3'-dephosphocoenzyme-A synthase [Mesoplasma sp. JKS002664]MCL8212306.1 2-(5''-triphosphoribosyl)-3'-dephosphocoenzyme-A synthase [Mesoplasma sp. JKS002662]MCL8212433.1 2-(5''-triphosphoribosyl)-3'-dephosphocoenzyme-A synthase [Mesoplasma sp. JKS002661]MCL8214165.1 2-(5''-triphosphoribosyl)-3'-dephosphocoenzyme-A synthase [Mesoplasma sp. JKS002658]MCL8214791.1 2-(5''-triphos
MRNKKVYYQAALKAIKSEMESYPSLGLVSKINSGSHKDMDINDFYKSYEVFPAYLQAIEKNLNEIKTFLDLRIIGLKYEQAMLEQTNQINTHKGLIFALGIFYYSLLKNRDKTKIIPEIKTFCFPLKEDFKGNLDTKGLAFYQQGINGARQTALSGYQVVFDAYDFYYQLLVNQQLAENEVNFTLLLYFLVHIEDTTLISKIGISSYRKVQIRASILLKKLQTNYQQATAEIETFNNWAIKNNISPGGSADLLVLVDLLIFSNY